MDSVTTLVLCFLTADGNEHQISIKTPKDDLTLSQVTTAMQTIIDSEAFVTSKNESLDSIGNCYYRTVTKTPLTDPGGGE